MNLYRIHYLKSILYREPSFILKYYLHKETHQNRADYVYMADGKMVHGGMFDRLKGAISIYALSKVHGKKYGIYFTEPFPLEKYLEPNNYDWRVNKEDLTFSFPQTRPIIAFSEKIKPKRLLRERNGQTHYYYGSNILDFINQWYGTEYKWTTLFNELFRPSPYLEVQISRLKKDVDGNYIAVHLRFLNMLGDKVEILSYPELKEEEKQSLIADCLAKIRELYSNNKGKLLFVSSDSETFMVTVKKEIPEVKVVSGSSKHIDNSGKLSEEDCLKLFLDIYMLAGAERVYSIIGKGLYSSAFPEYSAKIGGKPFERIIL